MKSLPSKHGAGRPCTRSFRDLDPADFEPGLISVDAQQGRTEFGVRSVVVCAIENEEVEMTPALWPRVWQKYRELGRTLTREELLALVGR